MSLEKRPLLDKHALKELEDEKHLMFTVVRGKNKRFVLLIKDVEKIEK